MVKNKGFINYNENSIYKNIGSGILELGDSLYLRDMKLGSSNLNPAQNIAALRSAGITTNGVYWFKMNNITFQAYCRFNYIDGNDWYLLLKVFSQGDIPSGSSYWSNSTLYNENDFDLMSGTWSKYSVWNNVSFNRVMLEMWQNGVRKIPPIMIYNNTKASFYAAIQEAGTPSNGSGLRCDSTDPAIASNATYWNVAMKSGSNFLDQGGSEDIMQHYGISCWNNNSINSTTAEGLSSIGRAGAWIGCPLDEGGHTFNAVGNSGADSGFGFGASTGNPAKTTSAGYSEWTITSSTNTLPGYVWVR